MIHTIYLASNSVQEEVSISEADYVPEVRTCTPKDALERILLLRQIYGDSDSLRRAEEKIRAVMSKKF